MIKSTDYMVIQAPMITELHLKGNSLLLFALITGFSKDQQTRFRGSLNYMSEWLNTSKSAVVRALDELEKDGLIKKYPVMVGKLVVNEYSSMYDEALNRIGARNVEANEEEGGIKMEPVSKWNRYQSDTGKVSESSTITVPVSKRDQYHSDNKVVPEWQRSGTRMRTNNIDNIINYSFSCLPAEEQQQEQQEFFKTFFWRNAKDPAEEVKRFVGHNNANGWSNQAGREYDTAVKRQGLAALWQFQESDRVPMFFLSFWQQIYFAAKRSLLKGADVLLDVTAGVKEGESSVILSCKRSTMEFIESNMDKFCTLFQGFLQGRKLQYQLTR